MAIEAGRWGKGGIPFNTVPEDINNLVRKGWYIFLSKIERQAGDRTIYFGRASLIAAGGLLPDITDQGEDLPGGDRWYCGRSP